LSGNFRKIKGNWNFNNFDFYEVGRKTMPVVGRIGLQRFVKSFQTGGGQTDASKGSWRPRKRSYTHPILVKSGRLMRSIKIRRQRHDRVVFGTTGVPYANYHNEGTNRLPKREFVGDSQELFRQIEKILDRNILKDL